MLNNPLTWILVVSLIGGLVTIGIWIGCVEAHIVLVKEFMRENSDGIKQIFSRFPPVPVSNKSPLQLTDLGKDIGSYVLSCVLNGLRSEPKGSPLPSICQP